MSKLNAKRKTQQAVDADIDQYKDELSISKFVPFRALISPETVLTTEGDYIACFEVDGVSFEGMSDDMLDDLKKSFNLWVQTLNPRYTVWTHLIRSKVYDRLHSEFDNEFARSVDEKYYARFAKKPLLRTRLFVSLVYKGYENAFARKLALKARTIESYRTKIRETKSDFLNMVNRLEERLRRYEPERLKTFVEKDVTYSSQLAFLNFLITGKWQRVRVPKTTLLHDYIGNAWIHKGFDMMEVKTIHGSRFFKGIDVKEYSASQTYAGVLNQLLFNDVEFVMTQSFTSMKKQKALAMITSQSKRLSNAGDAGTEQIDQLQLTKNMLINNEISLGEHHFTVFVNSSSPELCEKEAAVIADAMENEGILPFYLSTGLAAGYFAQFPGNWSYRPRPLLMTSANFSGMSPFHNFQAGKRDRNPWGPAISIFNSPSNQPLYFNFHGTPEDKDSTEDLPSGNTTLIGVNGSGKTTLVMFILSQCLKYAKSPNGFSCVYFDKDRGAELALRALGGNYYRFEIGVPTGLNPFACEDTPTARRFLKKLVSKLVRLNNEVLGDDDRNRISQAVDSVMSMPIQLRRLKTVWQNITTSTSGIGINIKARLERWIEGRENGWVFDNPTDTLTFNKKNIFGFDGTVFLDDSELRGAITTYLIYRVSELIDGRYFIMMMDECWRWLDDSDGDSYIMDFAKNQQFTIRKKSGLGLYMTQDPQQILDNPASDAIVKQSPCNIFLPNPKATYEDYVDGFKLTEEEFNIVCNLDIGRRQFLYKNQTISAVGEFSLPSEMSDEIAVLSGGENNVKLFDSIVAETGSLDPAVWLPIFYQRRKAASK